MLFMLWICSSANFGEKKCYSRGFVIESEKKRLEERGIDPLTSRMLSERSTI